jgi:radical SAM-linked protein
VQTFRKVQLYFVKTGDARFLSHLDVSRTMERAIRRSGVPVRFTEGMNPRVKMSFPSALPLGMESRLEAVLLQVSPSMTLREVVERLGRELPEGLRPFDADELFTGEKWRVAEILYELLPAGDGLPGEGELDALLARETIPVVRRGRDVDLRPLLAELVREPDRIRLAIAWTDSGTARPEDLLRAMGRDPDQVRVVKVGIAFRTSFGETIRKTDGSQDSHQPR